MHLSFFFALEIKKDIQKHTMEDNVRFAEINHKLDSILEVMSAFRLGGKGVAWIIGVLVGLGSLIIIIMQILKH